MTIKFELPSDDELVLKHIGSALTNIAAELRGDVVTTSTEPCKNLEQMVGRRERVEQDTTPSQYESLSADGANVAADVEEGPYYWVHPESESYGIAETLDKLSKYTDDPLTQVVGKDEFEELVFKWSRGGATHNDTPPPPASEPTPDPKSEPATDVAEQGESADVPAAGVELDTNGLPWDGRIHSANKTKNADDSWRYSRKPKKFDTDEEWKQYIARVEVELKGALGNTDDTPPPPPVAETVQDDTPPPPPPAVDDVSTPFDQAVTADLDVPPPPPAVDDVPTKTFPELMKLVTSNAAKGSVAKVQAILAERDLGSLQTLNTARPDMVSTVYAELERQLGE